MTETQELLTDHQAGSKQFVFLNYHSSAARKLHHLLISQGLYLQAITYDSSLIQKKKLIRLTDLGGISMIDTTDSWQTRLTLSSRIDGNNLDVSDCKKLNEAIDCAKLKLLTWLSHREGFGQGISELQANVIINNCLSNALALLDEFRPCLIVSLVAACTPFDICIVSLAEKLGIVVASLSEVNLRGFYYLTFKQFEHAQDIAVLASNNSIGSDNQVAATQYLRNYLKESPYYINSDLYRSSSCLMEHRSYLGVLAAKSLTQANALNVASNKPRTLYTSIELQRVGFAASRGLKHDTAIQAQKERMRASYLEYIASNICEIPQKPAILILLDYYPEITRYPIGGDDYFYSNYFVLAKILKKARLFGLCDSSQIYVKEHPAMLEVSNHSHPRIGLNGIIKNYGAFIASPLQKTTSLLLANPQLVVITGVSNAGLEASLIGCTTVTTSKPWWLCMPNTYYYNIYTHTTLSFSDSFFARYQNLFATQAHLHIRKNAKRAYLSFIEMHCVNLGMSMSEIDTLLSPQTDMNSKGFMSIAKTIMSRLTLGPGERSSMSA